MTTPRRVVFARVGLIYLASRVVTTLFVLLAAHLSGPASRYGENPTLGTLSMGWDAQWYWVVAVDGYPTDLPRGTDGVVEQNAWAFMPIYPWIARAFSVVLGGNYPSAAIIVSLVAGYGACLALYALLRSQIGERATVWAVLFFATGPLAALFQLGYAEALFLLWLLLALVCVQRRRYGPLYLLIPLMGYTRPGVLAFALMLAGWGIWRWWNRRRDPLATPEIIHIVVLGLYGAAVGLSWPVIAGVVTGEPSAYLETELAWRRDWVGAEESFVPVSGFVQASMVWFGLWGLPPALGPVGVALLVAAAVYALGFSRWVRRVGVVARLWSASYLVYLLLVFFPQSSIFRLLLPIAPAAAALAVPRSLPWRVGVLVGGAGLQVIWILMMYASGNTYWQIP